MIYVLVRNRCNALARKLLLFLVIASGGLRPAFGLDPQKAITQYGHDIWVRQNGLPANAVNVSLQAHDGYLWLGTAAGLFRFDGARFAWINADSEETRNRETVSTLCETRDGSLWIGTEFSGLRRLTNGSIHVFNKNDGFDERNIKSIVEDRKGQVWVGTSNGLFKFTGTTFTSVPVDPLYVSAIAEDSSGRIWVGTQAGLRLVDDNGKIAHPYSVPHGPPAPMVSTLFADSRGNLWIGTFQGLIRWKDSVSTTFGAADGLTDAHITAICEDRDGNIWAGTNSGGVCRFARGRWSSMSTAEGLTNDHVLSIMEDHEGSLWISTLEGLNRLKNVFITSYTAREGLANDFVSSVLEMPDGAMYFLSDAGSAFTCFRDGRATRTSLAVGPAYVARDGSLWIGQSGSLTNVRQGRTTRYDTRNGLPPKWISAVCEDREGLIIFIDHLGIRRFDGKTLRPYLLGNGQEYASTEYVICFCLQPDGTLWAGTSRGLVRFHNGEYTVFGVADGMADDWVNSIYDDRCGSLWIGSPRGGLTRLKGTTFTAYTTKSGLFTNEIYCVLGDDEGGLWLSSPRGIGHVTRQELDDFEAGRIPAVQTQVFTAADGMKTEECFGAWQPAGWKAHDGHLWFATMKGAVEINPRAISRNTVPPPVLIEEMVADGKKVTQAPAISLPPGTENLEFHYAALSYLVPERVLCRYMLEGYDKGWVDAGTRRVAYYTNLRPGHYRFRVMACNNDGVWNETGATVAFTLVPHFYEEPWFFGACACLLVLAGVGTHSLRVRTLKKREHHLEELVQVRTKELNKQQALLQTQRSFLRQVIDLNPSFIFAKDADGRFTLANSALAQFYGTSVDALTGKTDADVNPRKAEAERLMRDDREVIASKAEKFSPEEEYTGIDGKKHWMQVNRIPLVTEDDNAGQVLGVATDITQQKEAKEAAEAATRSKSEFLANMSHEIRTPLNAVIGMTGLLLDTGLTAEQREFVEIVRTSSDALLTIINDILDFSKIESGKLDLERQPFSLAGCIEESLDLLSSKAVEKKIELAYMLDENTPHDIVGDITRLRQILVNLLSNAVKFTHKGEVVISVASRRLEGNQHELRFSVRDTGIGIPQDRVDRLFKSFSQVDSSTTRQYGGTGLGLAISKRLSELMGGRMWVESQEGMGSTFFFTMIAPSAPTAPRLYLKADQPQLAGKRVLIVDDNETNRRILSLQTCSWEMIPEAVASGPDALELLMRGRTFDLAILDLHMPGMDGASLALNLRQLPGLRKMPLVMLTSMAASRQQLGAEYGDLGLAAFLNKPIKPSQLYDVITTIFGNHKEGPALAEPRVRLDADMGKRYPLRILLAEDNVINQKVALRVLQRFGYRADVVGNGIEAIEAVKRQHYDLVFMDVHMPEMDGLEATRRICADMPDGRPHIIAMTANALQGDREECLAAGMDGYISKPVSFEELRSVLEQYGSSNLSQGTSL